MSRLKSQQTWKADDLLDSKRNRHAKLIIEPFQSWSHCPFSFWPLAISSQNSFQKIGVISDNQVIVSWRYGMYEVCANLLIETLMEYGEVSRLKGFPHFKGKHSTIGYSRLFLIMTPPPLPHSMSISYLSFLSLRYFHISLMSRLNNQSFYWDFSLHPTCSWYCQQEGVGWGQVWLCMVWVLAQHRLEQLLQFADAV